MRFLGVTETCDLGSLYTRLLAEGHEVKIAVSEPLAAGTLAGVVPRTHDWRRELDWLRSAPDLGIIMFEAVSEGFGALQDELRRDGFNVIGGSASGDRLENDRAFSQRLLADLGFAIAGVREFSDASAADAFLAANPARYVLKFSGPDFASHDNYVGERADGSDVRAMLAARLRGKAPGSVRFILMDFLDGIEMGVGAYFNGDRFLLPACLDWEHKRFFPGNLGELTGEMGTIATFDRSRVFFERTLAPLEPFFREHGHVGYVNLNTIVNESGIWPLEFTCRFGYPGFAVLEPLQAIGWGDLLARMAGRSSLELPTRSGFCAGVVMTTPPFPYSRKDIDEPVGMPVFLPDPLGEEDRRHIHFGEVGLEGGHWVTSGLYGWTLVVTGVSATIAGAKEEAYARLARISVPNARYRKDIGDRLAAADFAALETLGVLDR
ncbi:MAG: hypothetical protein ACXW2T_06445 [Allosphingosinicella sp.]